MPTPQLSFCAERSGVAESMTAHIDPATARRVTATARGVTATGMVETVTEMGHG